MALCPLKALTGASPPSLCMNSSCTWSKPESKPDWKAATYLHTQKGSKHANRCHAWYQLPQDTLIHVNQQLPKGVTSTPWRCLQQACGPCTARGVGVCCMGHRAWCLRPMMSASLPATLCGGLSLLTQRAAAQQAAVAGTPEYVRCEVGICCCSEPPWHHLHHWHHHMGQTDLQAAGFWCVGSECGDLVAHQEDGMLIVPSTPLLCR
jgi:hypothetical protein